MLFMLQSNKSVIQNNISLYLFKLLLINIRWGRGGLTDNKIIKEISLSGLRDKRVLMTEISVKNNGHKGKFS